MGFTESHKCTIKLFSYNQKYQIVEKCHINCIPFPSKPLMFETKFHQVALEVVEINFMGKNVLLFK